MEMKDCGWKKKIFLSGMMVLFTIALTGCGIDLTDEQNRVIAEYAADLLLKYDADYQERYGNDYDAASEDGEDMTTEAFTTEDLTTETMTEDTTEASEADTGSDDGEAAEEDSTVPNEDSGISNDTVDIAEIVGISGASIVYNSCMFLDQYPSLDSDGTFIYLEAEEGYKLVVLKFDIANASDMAVEVDLLNSDISYQLVMNDTKTAKPMLTILMDDLGTFSNTVPADSEQSAVLIFQMSDSSIKQIESLNLRVLYHSEEHVIHIQ